MFGIFSKSAIEPADPARALLKDMQDYFGQLPDPTHEPIRFEWFCRLYKYKMGQKGVEIKFPPEAVTEHKLDVRV